MLKKLSVAVFALVLGAVSHAAEMVSLGIYFSDGGSIDLVGEAPAGVYRSKNIKDKNGNTSFPCYIGIAKPQSVKLMFKVTGDVVFYASLYPFIKDAAGLRTIPVKCNKFNFNGKPIPGVPGVITGWKRMLTRKLKDGDVFSIELELEKQAD